MIEEEAREIRLRDEFVETLSSVSKFDTKVTRVRVVLPAYNEQDALEKLIERIVQTPARHPGILIFWWSTTEVSDRTVSVVRKLQEFYPIKLVCHEVNKMLRGGNNDMLDPWERRPGLRRHRGRAGCRQYAPARN